MADTKTCTILNSHQPSGKPIYLLHRKAEQCTACATAWWYLPANMQAFASQPTMLGAHETCREANSRSSREDVAAQLCPSSLRQCHCSGQDSTVRLNTAENVPKQYRTACVGACWVHCPSLAQELFCRLSLAEVCKQKVAGRHPRCTTQVTCPHQALAPEQPQTLWLTAVL